eukprot:TRINITY_DN6856_c0_g1_i1.p1 TRINITY_DN6856_c0_g1~~TRINITY_DN6856_c0_g1_i1.p1  ORF type:complete len:867 (-),score=191.24 TRINITY_DN6856_c0_g1_i1:66-2666(-)
MAAEGEAEGAVAGFVQLVQEQGHADAFSAYLKKVGKWDSLDFFMHVERFRGIDSDTDMKHAVASQIFALFFHSRAPAKLRIPQDVKATLREKFKEGKEVDVTNSMFDDAQTYIVQQLKEELYPAFLKEYKESNGAAVPPLRLRKDEGLIPEKLVPKRAAFFARLGGLASPRPNKRPRTKSKKQQIEEVNFSSPSGFKQVVHVDTDYNWSSVDPMEQFDLVDLLGEGAYGAVYKAKHKETGIELAAKIVRGEAQTTEELQKEMNILKKCKNANIVQYYGCCYDEVEEELWILMDFCAGGSTLDLIKGMTTTLSEAQIAAIIFSTIKGIIYLHSEQIVHRDVKAANILLTEDGVVKIADFGVSAQLGATGKAKTATGTPLWMAPEVLGEGGSYNHKADIWSLGITAVELADKKPPRFELNLMRAMFVILEGDPPTLAKPQDWSPEFNDFLANCFQKDPALRPTAVDLLVHPWIQAVHHPEKIVAELLQAERVRRTKEAEEKEHNKERDRFQRQLQEKRERREKILQEQSEAEAAVDEFLATEDREEAATTSTCGTVRSDEATMDSPLKKERVTKSISLANIKSSGGTESSVDSDGSMSSLVTTGKMDRATSVVFDRSDDASVSELESDIPRSSKKKRRKKRSTHVDEVSLGKDDSLSAGVDKGDGSKGSGEHGERTREYRSHSAYRAPKDLEVEDGKTQGNQEKKIERHEVKSPRGKDKDDRPKQTSKSKEHVERDKEGHADKERAKGGAVDSDDGTKERCEKKRRSERHKHGSGATIDTDGAAREKMDALRSEVSVLKRENETLKDRNKQMLEEGAFLQDELRAALAALENIRALTGIAERKGPDASDDPVAVRLRAWRMSKAESDG